jgi:diaminopimelate decarboxylase
VKGTGPIPQAFVADADGRLCIGGLSADALAEAAGGTPLFVYDRAIVARQIAAFRTAMPAEVALHYAVKANPNAELLVWLAGRVDGFDLASGGELDRLLDAGVDTRTISFAGPGKRDAELRQAIAAGVTINLESEGEAARALAVSKALGVQPKLAVRVNPPFGLKGSGMKMGGLASPFGVDHDRVPALVGVLLDAGADWRGLHVYAGSQCLDADALIETQRQTVALAANIADAIGRPPPEVNLGGGFGIPYFHGDEPLDIAAVGAALARTLADRPASLSDTRFAIELGRWLVGEAGVYLTRIVDRKVSRDRTFLVTDGGLQHMLAASGNFGQLLRRNYPVAAAGAFGASPGDPVTIVGCLCTPLDMLADDVALPPLAIGDLIAIFCAGAYGLSASPQAFLSQPAARERLV